MTLYYLGVVEYERRNWKVQGKPSTVNTGKVFKRWGFIYWSVLQCSSGQ